MYIYVQALVLPRKLPSEWVVVDISTMLVSDIFKKYVKVYVTLSNVSLPSNVYVDLDVLRGMYSTYSDTLNNLLIALGSQSLQTVPNLPSSNVTRSTYSDAIRAGYKINTCVAGSNLPANFPTTNKHDLLLTRPNYNTDMSLIHNYCLVSVNGYYHLTDTDSKVAYVYKGADTMRKSNNNTLGMLSFINVGKLTKIPLTATNIKPQALNAFLKDKIYITTTASLDNMSYMLVLGGYLVFPEEGIFWRNGDNSFALDINKIPYLERLFESNLYIDLSPLGLDKSSINPDLLNIPNAYSDSVLTNYLTLSQSYLVIIDVPYMATDRQYIRNCKMPGMFTSYVDPTQPLIVGHGRVAEYWKVYEDGQWAVNTVDSYLRNYIALSQSSDYEVNITNALRSDKPYNHSEGFLLDILGYSL